MRQNVPYAPRESVLRWGSHERKLLAKSLEAYSEYDDLDAMMFLEFGENLVNITSERKLRSAIIAIIRWAENNDKVLSLIQVALSKNPTNVQLGRLLEELRATGEFFDGVGAGADVPDPPAPASYAAILTEIPPLLKLPTGLLGRTGYVLLVVGSVLASLRFFVPIPDQIPRIGLVLIASGFVIFFTDASKKTNIAVIMGAIIALVAIAGVTGLVIGFVVSEILQLVGW